ncbi:dihydropyrimidinase [Vibrio sp. WXL210]|uniref:dihydropyrimidinase n=1 Tax=Vibrio sp. WXL210 TaxID=3450709 RepID=UPI003EC4AE67
MHTQECLKSHQVKLAGRQGADKPLLIRNGLVVEADSQRQADVLILDGKIAQVSPSIDSEGCCVIDANGHYVMPGGIDVHTHLNIDVGISRSCDDFFTGTRSAAMGGTTTIIDHMGFGPKGCDLFHQLKVYKQYAKANAVIDYGFHGVIQHIDDKILSQMAPMVEREGISSFKLYLTYGYKLDDQAAFQALQELRRVGALTTVHPENDAVITLERERLLAEGKTSARYHAISRPLECEVEAIGRMINLAKLADNAPLYIVHLSNGLGLDYARLARSNNQPVYVETCPQYLLLDDSYYERADALKYILSPPLRPKAEQDKLWQGLIDGSIDTVATDHCAFTYHEQKQLGADDFTRCPNGLPGVAARMPLMFSHGVMNGRMSPSEFVRQNCTMPAKLFGLYPQKGTLQPGSDADVVIFDPSAVTTLRHELLLDNSDYTPFEGQKVQGWPVVTLSRGAVVAWHGEFVGEAGQGRFLPRQRFVAPTAVAPTEFTATTVAATE